MNKQYGSTLKRTTLLTVLDDLKFKHSHKLNLFAVLFSRGVFSAMCRSAIATKLSFVRLENSRISELLQFSLAKER